MSKFGFSSSSSIAANKAFVMRVGVRVKARGGWVRKCVRVSGSGLGPVIAADTLLGSRLGPL